MDKKINSLVEEIFKGIPYSKEKIEIKGKVLKALNIEYCKESITHNETQAFGIIVYKYGTLLDAAKLAGVKEEEIIHWSGEKNKIDKLTFIKQFKVQKVFYTFISLLVSAFLVFLTNFITYKDGMNIAMLCTIICIAFVLFSIDRNRRIKSIGVLNQAAYIECVYLNDRYVKRYINTVFIVIFSIAYFILTYLIIGLKANYSFNEMLSMVLRNSFVLVVATFILIRNGMINRWLRLHHVSERRFQYDKHKHTIVFVSVLYWAVVFLIFYAIKDLNLWLFTCYTSSMILYICMCGWYNFHYRKRIVVNNIVLNRKRVVVYSMVLLATFFIQVMKMDNWILQPYISTIPRVEYTPDQIAYDDQTGIYSIVTDKKDFKILQLTDIHLGGSAMSSSKDQKALSAVYKLIEYAKPDFVVVTGDLVFPMGIFSYSLNNKTPIIQFTNFMRNVGVPWAFVYGNHDTESMATGTPDEINDIFTSASFKTSGTLLYPYIQPEITGRNNQMIMLKNNDGSLRQALFLMDSNDYVGDKLNDYDYIHDDQVEWYKNNVESIK